MRKRKRLNGLSSNRKVSVTFDYINLSYIKNFTNTSEAINAIYDPQDMLTLIWS